MILLKEISHNFLSEGMLTQALLLKLFSEEDKFIEETGTSDATFGIYQK
jgi:hypothetical protein